jgi:plastocyanin
MRVWVAAFFAMVLAVAVLALSAAESVLSSPIPNAATATQTVDIANFFFSPNPITVTQGTSIVWNNTTTGTTHTSSSDPLSAMTWDTGFISPSTSSAGVVFNQLGTFNYHCNIHPSMKASVIVVAADTSTPTDTPTATETPTATPDISSTSTGTPTATSTVAETNTPTSTDTPTSTGTPVDTAIPSQTPTDTGSPTASPTVTATAGATDTPTSTPTTVPRTTNQVSIVDFAFQPDPVTIWVGTTVTWTNMSQFGTNHTVTSDSGSFDSGNLAPAARFLVTFSAPGTYNYHCTYHQDLGMVGTIQVIPPPFQISLPNVTRSQ